MDVRLYQTDDGGEVDFVAGEPTITDGLETAVYLSLFGGNAEDSGLQADERKQWWGNLVEPEAAFRYRSETQHLIEALPATTGNMRRIEDAALRDVAWLVTSGVAQSAKCAVGIPALNQVHLYLEFLINGQVVPVEFTKAWKSA